MNPNMKIHLVFLEFYYSFIAILKFEYFNNFNLADVIFSYCDKKNTILLYLM